MRGGAVGNPVEVIGHGNAVTLCHWEDLVLAVGEEGSPLDGGLATVGPVEDGLTASMTDGEVAAFVGMGKADDEGTHLVGRARGVDVGLEHSRGGGVDLNMQSFNKGR